MPEESAATPIRRRIETAAAAQGGPSCYIAEPASGASGSVVVLPEVFGWSPHVLALCDWLAASGLAAICPDVYHRTPGLTVMPESDEGLAAGFAALAQISVDDAVGDVAAALELASRCAPRTPRLLGLSVGGLIGYLAAARLPIPQVALAYPAWLTAGHPPLKDASCPLAQMPLVPASTLILIGSEDAIIPARVQAELDRRLSAHGHEVRTYPGVAHGFFAPHRPAYAARAAQDAFERIRRHLGARTGQAGARE